MSKVAQANAPDAERRGGHREPIRNYFKVFRLEDGEPFGDPVDLSETGMRVACSNTIEPGSETDVEVEWEDSSGTAKRFSLRIEARWCRPASGGTSQVAGFRVVDATPVQRMALQMMVSNFASQRG